MKRGNLHYALLQAALWGAFGVVSVYAVRYLIGLGLSNTQAGLVTGAATCGSLALQPVITELVDRRRVTLRGTLAVLGGLMALCLGGAELTRIRAARVALYAVANVALGVLPCFVNALGMVGSRAGLNINFGVTRGLGSLSYGIFTQIANLSIVRWGDGAVSWLGLGLGLGLGALCVCFPAGGAPEHREQPTGLLEFLGKNRDFTVFLLGNVLLMVGHNALGNSMYQVALHKGDPDAQGTALMIAAVLELPAMFCYSRMREKRGDRPWVICSAVFITARIVLCLGLPGVAGLYAAQLAQVAGYAIFAVGTVCCADTLVAPADAVKAQACVGAASTAGALTASFLCGMLMDVLGVGWMLGLAAAAAAAGAVLVALPSRNPAAN